MTVLSGASIEYACRNHGLLDPWSVRTEHLYQDPVGEVMTTVKMTHGIGPAGYDVTVDFGEAYDVTLKKGDFVLAATRERFKMPDNLIGIVHDKSSWARRGLAVQNTVIEPGWEGWLTLELTNHGPDPLLMCHSMPIAQVLFHILDQRTDRPYDGKYQNQEQGPQEAR